jgi:hypothetical protein
MLPGASPSATVPSLDRLSPRRQRSGRGSCRRAFYYSPGMLQCVVRPTSPILTLTLTLDHPSSTFQTALGSRSSGVKRQVPPSEHTRRWGGGIQMPGSNAQQCAACAALVEQRQAEQQQRQPSSFHERFQVRDARWLLSPTAVEVTPEESFGSLTRLRLFSSASCGTLGPFPQEDGGSLAEASYSHIVDCGVYGGTRAERIRGDACRRAWSCMSAW